MARNIFFGFISLLLLFSCSDQRKMTTIKLAHSLDVTHPVHKAMVFMSEKVKEKSSGRMEVDIYPAMNQILKKYDAGLHLKTAGTSWLEELIGLSEAGGEGLKIAKHIYLESFKYYDDLCAPYLNVIDISKNKLPTPHEVDQWTGEKFSQSLRHDQHNPNYNLNFRQLLHVGYKIASKLGPKYLNELKANEEIISKNVTENIFHRHIETLFLDKD